MAEAHQAVAFTFTVTPDGDVDMSLNWVLLETMWQHMVKSVHRRLLKFKNGIHNGLYPLKPIWWLSFSLAMYVLALFSYDFSFGCVEWLCSFRLFSILPSIPRHFIVEFFFWTMIWMLTSMLIRWLFRMLLSYKGWMNDEFGKGKWYNVFYLKVVQFVSQRGPLLFGLQTSLPALPLPSIHDTVKRHLVSVEPLLSKAEFQEMKELSDQFERKEGPKLQRYLWFKWLTSSNYVTDWWEQYVYLKGRSPIMVNSNFYGLDMMYGPPTTFQAARAANITFFALKYRNLLDREMVKPVRYLLNYSCHCKLNIFFLLNRFMPAIRSHCVHGSTNVSSTPPEFQAKKLTPLNTGKIPGILLFSIVVATSK